MGAAKFDLRGARAYVAGHGGMVGRAIVERLAQEGATILTASRHEADLRRQDEVERWMGANRPDIVFLAAAKVGGIYANSTYPAEFIYDNLMIEANLIEAARITGVRKLVFLGSACIFPKDAPQPMSEGALLTGPLEPTNEWYAVAKIAGIKLTQAYRRQYGCDFIAVQPTNLYGSADNFDLANSHVIPALIRKAHDAAARGQSEMAVWGTGAPRREFLHVDDLADALIFLAQAYSDQEIVNVGSGDEVTIAELAQLIAGLAGFKGQIVFDASKPDGVMRKLVDSSKLQGLGWRRAIPLQRGLADTYQWFRAHETKARGVTPAGAI